MCGSFGAVRMFGGRGVGDGGPRFFSLVLGPVPTSWTRGESSTSLWTPYTPSVLGHGEDGPSWYVTQVQDPSHCPSTGMASCGSRGEVTPTVASDPGRAKRGTEDDTRD